MRRVGTLDGVSAVGAVRARICRWCARLANRETRPAVVGSRHRRGETPTLYFTCRQATASAQHTTQATFLLSVATAQIGATRPHTTGYQRRLSPRHKHSERNSEPWHFKAPPRMNRPQTSLSSTITPGVSRPAASALICFYPL